MHPLDASLELTPLPEPPPGCACAFACRPGEHYRNAIGPFGGWIAALLLQGVLRAPEARGTPLALDALFMGGMDASELELRVYALRQNRTVGFWRSEAWQKGRLCSQAQVTLSMARESLVVMQDARFPQVPGPEQLAVYDNPRTPMPWVDQYVFKPVSGVLFSGAETMDSLLWVRDAEPRRVDALSLSALCDTPFPSPWIRLRGQVPVSTVTYSVYYRATEAELAEAGDGYTLLDSHACLARGGYVDQFTSLWSTSGRLLAQTQQMLWFADPPAQGG